MRPMAMTLLDENSLNKVVDYISTLQGAVPNPTKKPAIIINVYELVISNSIGLLVK